MAHISASKQNDPGGQLVQLKGLNVQIFLGRALIALGQNHEKEPR